MSLKQKTVSGVLWTGLAKMGMQLVLFVVTVILARLLSPDDFGVVGMAAIVTVAITMVNDRGLGVAIVQKKDVAKEHLSSLFWGGLFFGIFLFALLAVASMPLAHFFKKPIVRAVFSVQAVGFIIGAFGIVQKSLLTKEMAFKKLSIIEVSSVIVSGVVSILMAVRGMGVWSLVFGIIVRDAVGVIFLWLITPWKPAFHFSWREFKIYIGFSAQVLANNVSIYAITNADVTVIGRIMGAELLGFYSLALNLVKLPVTRLSGIVAKVVFPAFSHIQDDLKKFKSAYLRSMTFISLLTFPILAGLGVFAGEFIRVFLGEKWMTMLLPLQILVPMAMLKSVGTIKGSVLLARGRPDIELKWNLAYFIPLIGVLIFGAKHGLVGVAAAFTGLYLVTFPIIQQITNRQVGASMFEFFKAFGTTGPATIIMAIAGISLRLLMKNVFNFTDLVVLLLGVVASAAIYVVSIWFLKRTLFLEFMGLMRKKKASEDTETVAEELFEMSNG